MNLNLMNFLFGKLVSEKLGETRSTQLGLVAGMMQGYQGVMLSAIVASREEPTATKVVDPKVAEEQAAMLKKLQEALASGASAGVAGALKRS